MKTCYQCGTPLDDATVFCTNCGAPMGNQPQPAAGPNPAGPMPQPGQSMTQGPTPGQTVTPASSLLEPAPTEPQVSAGQAPESQFSDSGIPAGQVAESGIPAGQIPGSGVSTPAYQPVNQPAKDSKTLLLIIGMAACALLGVAGLAFGIMKSSQKPSTPATPNTAESAPVETQASGTKVAFGNWQVTVPDDMAFETDDDELIIGDTTGSQWVAYIDYDSSAAFSNIAGNFSTFGDYLTSHGYRNVKTGKETVNDMEFYWADVTPEDTDLTATVAFAAAPDLYAFQITFAASSGEADHSILENVAAVLGTAEKVSKSLRSGSDGSTPLTVPTIEYKW